MLFRMNECDVSAVVGRRSVRVVTETKELTRLHRKFLCHFDLREVQVSEVFSVFLWCFMLQWARAVTVLPDR